jgi:general secretion pathway protein F
MWLGILFSVMNITGLFLTSFPGVPAAVQEITPWLAVLALALAGAALGLALRRESFRRRFQSWLLRFPLIGRQWRTVDTTRFASTLAILVGSGVPLLAALEAGRQVLTLLPLRDAVADATDRVREGLPLSRALGRSRSFPPVLVHLISSGEATGQLAPMLERAARLQQAELESRSALLTTLLEPALLLAMGSFVLLLVLAVMQPLIEINSLFG